MKLLYVVQKEKKHPGLTWEGSVAATRSVSTRKVNRDDMEQEAAAQKEE